MEETTDAKSPPARESFTQTNRRVLIVPDAAAPDRHEAAVGNVIRFAADRQPDQIVILSGQTLCRPCGLEGLRRERPRRLPAPWAPRDYDHMKLTTTVRELRRLGCDAPVRLEGHTADAAAEPCSADCLTRLNELDDLGITCGPNLAEVVPGWSTAYTRSASRPRYAGYVTITLARIMGRSVVCAGTDSLATVSESLGGSNGATRRWGIEIGRLRRISGSTGRFVLGFGLVEQAGSEQHARPIPPSARNSTYAPSQAPRVGGLPPRGSQRPTRSA